MQITATLAKAIHLQTAVTLRDSEQALQFMGQIGVKDISTQRKEV